MEGKYSFERMENELDNGYIIFYTYVRIIPKILLSYKFFQISMMYFSNALTTFVFLYSEIRLKSLP